MDYTRDQVEQMYEQTARRAARLTSEQRLTLSLQMFEMSRNLMRDRLREQFPTATAEELQAMLQERIRSSRGRAA